MYQIAPLAYMTWSNKNGDWRDEKPHERQTFELVITASSQSFTALVH